MSKQVPSVVETFPAELQEVVKDIYRRMSAGVETIEQTINQTINTGQSLVDRGDPSGYDYQIGDLTEDDAWHDLDLSSIVPAGAEFVLLRVAMDKATAETVMFRENGNSNEYNVSMVWTIGESRRHAQDCIVACDSNRVIEYKISGTLNILNITVGGWWA